MSIVRHIEKQYFEIENQYAINEFNARVNGFSIKEAYWKKKRELNTHAYFLFLFTRLEDHIKTQSTQLIQKKQTDISHWKTRAVWDNIEEPEKLHFKKKLALLTEKGNTDYNTIADYYKLRNTIAHGSTITNITTVVNMISVFTNIKKYFKELKGK